MPSAHSDRLSRPVDFKNDHVLGPENAEITLVHYGGYGCARCENEIERISELVDRFGDRLCYVFRHCPAENNDIARQAAELAEAAAIVDKFWETDVALMARGAALTQEDLREIAHKVQLSSVDKATWDSAAHLARKRVDEDIRSAEASGVVLLPTFFINGRRYTGPWDDSSFAEALEGSLAHRARAAALDFARWAASSGILLLLATLLAIVLTNSPIGPAFIGLVVGKPLGMVLAAGLAVRIGIAAKPDVFTWTQLTGAGVLAGIGFTMFLFIAGQAFPIPVDFAAAKIAIYMASIIAAVLSVLTLWKASGRPLTDRDHADR